MSDRDVMQEESMEDILSSIRSTVEKEVAKSGGSKGASAAKSKDAGSSAELDVFDLSTTQMVDGVPEAGGKQPRARRKLFGWGKEEQPAEDFIDIDAFAATGQLASTSDDALRTARKRYEGTDVFDLGASLATPAASAEEVADIQASLAALDLSSVELGSEEVAGAEEGAVSSDADVSVAVPEAQGDDLPPETDDLMAEVLAELAGAGVEEVVDAVPASVDATEATVEADDFDIDALLAGATETDEVPSALAVAEDAVEETPVVPSDVSGAEQVVAEPVLPADVQADSAALPSVMGDVSLGDAVTEDRADGFSAEEALADPVMDSAVAAHVEDLARAAMTGASVASAAPSRRSVAVPSASAVGEGDRTTLRAMPTAQGLQVAFPMEVLAEALRPLVHDWVHENLPDIVERLVREELAKLTER